MIPAIIHVAFVLMPVASIVGFYAVYYSLCVEQMQNDQNAKEKTENKYIPSFNPATKPPEANSTGRENDGGNRSAAEDKSEGTDLRQSIRGLQTGDSVKTFAGNGCQTPEVILAAKGMMLIR